MALDGIDAQLATRARAAAQLLQHARDESQAVTVVHHLDADGVTAGAIALEALARAGIESHDLMVKSLDDVHVAKVHDAPGDVLWFCDLGSAAYMHFRRPKIVCDHHELVRDGNEESFPHVNPLLDDLSGAAISGAGCAFLVAHALDTANEDLLPLALVGASGDLQDRDGGFKGANLVLRRLGYKTGLLDVRTDLAFYGPEQRPLRKYFGYADAPSVPGVTGGMRDAEAFLAALQVPVKSADGERTWSDLSGDEQVRVRSALVSRMLDCGIEADVIDGLFREVIRIAGEPAGPTRELQEFATLLNSTARYGRADVGLAVCRGDRDGAYREALELLLDHRKHLVGALQHVKADDITVGSGIQWIHLEDKVLDTVVGIVCGMALSNLRDDRALVGLAWTPDGRTKISSRAPAALQGRIDLAEAMQVGCAAVGGQGGGHKGAAGATIPREREREFLAHVDDVVAAQLGP